MLCCRILFDWAHNATVGVADEHLAVELFLEGCDPVIKIFRFCVMHDQCFHVSCKLDFAMDLQLEISTRVQMTRKSGASWCRGTHGESHLGSFTTDVGASATKPSRSSRKLRSELPPPSCTVVCSSTCAQ